MGSIQPGEDYSVNTTLRPKLGADALELIASRFRLLAEPMRLRLLQELQASELSVSHLAEIVESTQPNVSKHLKALQDAGMVNRRAEGNCAFYSVADETIFQLCDVVCDGLRDRLTAQAQLLQFPTRRG